MTWICEWEDRMMKLPTPSSSRGRTCLYHHPGNWEPVLLSTFFCPTHSFISPLLRGAFFADMSEGFMELVLKTSDTARYRRFESYYRRQM